jgi:DNA-binding MarR family transcriptional regulator
MYKNFTAMSNKKPAARPKRQALTPMIGSLLRLPHEVVVARILAALNLKGFDISNTELGVFLYPGPDGRRPIDLARQCNMTRQAMNYVLAGLERRGYIQRRAGRNSAARLVRLTDRGWEMVPLVRGCVAAIEQEWTAHLGARRFNTLRKTLHDLSLWLGKLG